MKQAYHDTIETTRLDEFEVKAHKCDMFVLDFMKQYPGRPFTPAEIWQLIDPGGLKPMTSIRRAMTNLTDAGLILHRKNIRDQKMGIYGRKNGTWVYPEVYVQKELF